MLTARSRVFGTVSKRLSNVTVQTRRTCGCRDNPQRQMAPRRRGSRVPSLCTVGSLGPRPFSHAAVRAGSRVLRLVAVLASFSLGCQPGSYESAPCVTWSVFGSPPLRTVRHCTGQVATDPQSPKGGSQRACPTRGAHPTASGRRGTVALLKQTYPAWQLGSGLFGMAAREIRVNPLTLIGPWVVTLW